MIASQIESIGDIYQKFLLECDSYEKYIILSQNMYINRLEKDGMLFDKSMRDLVIEHTFLKVFLCWEYFLEQVFLRYCMDFEGVNNNKLTRYVLPEDFEHAYDLARGNNPYPDWTSWENVVRMSQRFFKNGGTFEKLKQKPTDLSDIKVIRNSISHMSIKCRDNFQTLVRSRYGHYPIGTTPADFLLFMNTTPHNPISYFSHYISTIKILANEIVNP